MVARPVSLALLFLNPFFHLGPLPLSCLCKHWAPRRSVRVRPTPRQRRKVSSPTPKPRPAEDPSPPSPKRIALGLYVRARVLWDFWEILKTPRVEVSSLRVWPGGGFAQAGSAGQYHAKKNPKARLQHSSSRYRYSARDSLSSSCFQRQIEDSRSGEVSGGKFQLLV